MPGREIRGEYKSQSWEPERDLKRATNTIHNLQETIMDTENEIDEIRKTKETLEENIKKLQDVIRRGQREGASREVIESGNLRLDKCQKYSADRGLKLNKLKDKRHGLEATKAKWEYWRDVIEEEYNRRAAIEDWIRKKEPRCCESRR